MGHAQEEFHDRHEKDKDDEIIRCDLDDSIRRIPFCQRAPDEDHGRTGSRPQEHGAGKVLRRNVRRYPRFEYDEEEETGDAVHGERLDEPVHDPCDDEALRIFPDFPDAFKVDLHHHGINHDPDEDGDRYGNPCNRHISKKSRHGRRGFTNKHAGGHAEKYPDRQVAVEEADAFLFFLAHFPASFPSSWQGSPAPLSLQDSQVL